MGYIEKVKDAVFVAVEWVKAHWAHTLVAFVVGAVLGAYSVSAKADDEVMMYSDAKARPISAATLYSKPCSHALANQAAVALKAPPALEFKNAKVTYEGKEVDACWAGMGTIVAIVYAEVPPAISMIRRSIFKEVSGS